MSAPLQTPISGEEWFVRAGQRRRPPDGPPDKKAPRADTGGLKFAHEDARLSDQDIFSAEIRRWDSTVKRLAALRAEIRKGDAPKKVYLEHNWVVQRLQSAMPKQSRRRNPARLTTQSFEPSLSYNQQVFDRLAPLHAAVDQHMRRVARVAGWTPAGAPAIFAEVRPVKVKEVPNRDQGFLTQGEDLVLARRWRDAGDQSALDRLVTSHLPLARKLAYRIKSRDVGIEDLIAEANEALTRAAKTFDPDRGFTFATYGGRSAWHALMDATKIPEDAEGRSIRWNSLNTPMGESEEEFIDALETDEIEDDPWDESRESLHNILNGDRPDGDAPLLTPREQRLIQLRYGGQEVMKLEDVSKHIGHVSRERVRQLEERALNKIRGAL